jgi:hypothetical protein
MVFRGNETRSYGSNKGSSALIRRLLSLSLIASLMVALAAGWNAPAAAIDTAALKTASAVPADAQFYVAIDLDTNGEQITQALALLERAGLSDSEDSLSTISAGTEVGGVDAESVDELIDGEMALAGTGLNFDAMGAFSDLPLDGDLSDVDVDEIGSNVSPGIAVVLTASNLDEAIEQMLADFREDAQVAGTPIEESNVEGAQVFVVEADPVTGESGNVLAVLNDAVILGEVLEDIRPFIQASNGTVPALATDEDFSAAMAQLPAESLVASYVPALSDFEAVESLLGESGLPLALDLLLGPGGAAGFALSADDAGFRIDTVQLAREGQEFTASGVAADLTMADRLPSDSLLMLNGFDLGSSMAFRLIEQLLVVGSGELSGATGVMPEMTQEYMDTQFAEFVSLIGFNLQTEFIQQLDGEFGFALIGVNPMNPANFQAILASEVADPVAVTDALTSVGQLIQAVAQGSAQMSVVTIGDTDVNQIVVPVENLDGMPITVQYGVIEDEFTLSTGDAVVEYALGVSDPLSANPDFQEALSLLPAEYDGLFYLGTASLIEAGQPIVSGVGSDLDSGLGDASDRCADFVAQEDAQAAYDEDSVANFDLDLDFDGVACDDYFDVASTGTASAELDVQVNVGSFAAVSYKQDGMSFTSGILVVPGEE